MNFTRLFVALALVTIVGGCTKEPRCPVALLPPPAVLEPVKQPEPATPPTRRDQALAFVKLGYGEEHDEFSSLNFRTEALSTDVTKDAVMLVKAYNAFEGVKVAAALEQLRGDIMYYEFGREDSPVLYVNLPYWTSQQEKHCPANACREGAWGDDADAHKLDPSEQAALVQRVRTAFTAANADAIDPVMENEHVLRIWWD